MNNILTKLKDFVGINETDGYDEDYEEMDWEPSRSESEAGPPPSLEGEESPSRRRNQSLNLTEEIGMGTTTRNNVIGMPGITNSVAEVVVVEPHSFEDMPQVIQTLRERKSVILNLNAMDPEEAQRAVDFVAGGTYAIDGHQERIGESIFLFTPSCVKVSTLLGTVHEVPEISSPSHRPTPGVPTWGLESGSLAQ